MTNVDIERRAEALAEVILELLFARDFRDGERLKKDSDARSKARAKAYWVLAPLKEPAADAGLWNSERQIALLEVALKGLDEPETAIRDLASPLQMQLSRRTMRERGAAAPHLVRELRTALSNAKKKIEAEDRPRRRLDARSWSANIAYVELWRLWEAHRGPPARFPKDSDPFYQFAERGLEALEIPGIGGRKYASVRSVIEALKRLEEQGIILIPELD